MDAPAIQRDARLARINRGEVLPNTTRGSVDDAALASALSSSHIMGAALEVFEAEPMPSGTVLLAEA